MIRKALPLFEGSGHVRFAGQAGPVRYSIQGDPDRLRAGPARLRGVFSIDPDLAEQAFRAGDGMLMIESGAQLRIVMLAHTAGGSDVYVELRA
jgi:hypothetical protein